MDATDKQCSDRAAACRHSEVISMKTNKLPLAVYVCRHGEHRGTFCQRFLNQPCPAAYPWTGPEHIDTTAHVCLPQGRSRRADSPAAPARLDPAPSSGPPTGESVRRLRTRARLLLARVVIRVTAWFDNLAPDV